MWQFGYAENWVTQQINQAVNCGGDPVTNAQAQQIGKLVM